MHSALNRIAALSVVFTLFSPSVLAAWQKHSNDERMPDRTATDFDGKALLRTAKALSLPANVDLRDLTAQQAIDQFGKTHKLTINIDSAGAAISEPVTLKSSATVGEILLETVGANQMRLFNSTEWRDSRFQDCKQFKVGTIQIANVR